MSAVNNCSFIGRLTGDISLETTGSGAKLARFSVAVQRGKDATDFIPCTAWEASAEFAAKYFSKGSPIAVRGELRTNKSQKDGVTRTFYDVRVNDIDFVPGGGRGASSSGGASSGHDRYADREDREPDDDDDELPF